MASLGSVFFDERTRSFGCLHCLEAVEVRRSVFNDPEALLEMQEMVELDHSECSKYASVESARDARKFRKEAKRRQILMTRASGRIDRLGMASA